MLKYFPDATCRPPSPLKKMSAVALWSSANSTNLVLSVFGYLAENAGEDVKSVTLSIKDENGELFDFRGQPLHFELRII